MNFIFFLNYIYYISVTPLGSRKRRSPNFYTPSKPVHIDFLSDENSEDNESDFEPKPG